MCHRYFQVLSPVPFAMATGTHSPQGHAALRAWGHGHGGVGQSWAGGHRAEHPEANEVLLCLQVGLVASWDLAVSALWSHAWGCWVGVPSKGVCPHAASHPTHLSALSPQGSPPRPTEEPWGPWALEVSAVWHPPTPPPSTFLGWGADPLSPLHPQVELAVHKGNTAGGSGSNRPPSPMTS